ncbi:MAG: hypothetical protein WEE53_11155 [Acidimicrobiia bacterium]
MEGPVGGVDLDANGNLYVAETGRARIVKLEPNGTEVASFQPAEQFQRLLTLTIDRERSIIYASDDFADQFVTFDTRRKRARHARLDRCRTGTDRRSG